MSTLDDMLERRDCDEQGEPERGTYRQDLVTMAMVEGPGAGPPASEGKRATPRSTAHLSIERRRPMFWLRMGLAFVFGYAAIVTLLAPEEFAAYFPWFVPAWATHVAPRCFAACEVALTVAFLSGRQLHTASLLAAATLIAILAFNLDAFDVLFRNVAIASAALALASATGPDYPPATVEGAPTGGRRGGR